ncbi:unnamed protein product, partial [Symbiodinium sp. KB8]
AVGKAHGLEVAFVRIPSSSVALEAPEGWKGLKLKEIPGLVTALEAWKKVASAELSCSGTEPPRQQSKGRTRVEEELKGLGRLFRRPGAGDDEEDDDEEGADDSVGGDSVFLRPGPASSNKKPERPGKSKAKETSPPEVDVQQLLIQAIATGKSTNDLMPLLMLNLLQDRKKSKAKATRGSSSHELLGGSSSDESADEGDIKGRGMKAVVTLNKLHDQIRKHPRRVCEIFEKEARDELGIVAGQSWTLKDYMKKQPWGKFKGIYRCAIQDAAAYELLRAGKSDEAAAQLVQNMKSKIQSTLQGGDWQTAWLLTGLPDPMMKKDFAGTREEMAVVSGYMEAIHKLKKRVKDAQAAGHPDDEEETGALLVRAGNEVPLFPCVLPFPEVTNITWVEGPEQAEDWWAKTFVNTFVSWSNFLALGCPKKGSSSYEPRVLYRSDINEFAQRLLGEVAEFASFDLVAGLLECEGKRSLLEELLKQTRASYGVQVAAPSGALSVEADRVAIPTEAGAVDPLDWLPAEQALVVENLEEVRLPEHLWEDVVTACHRVPESQEAALATRLLSTRMAVLVEESELPRTSTGELLTGGLFCVGKNEAEDRLIYDRRPENSTMPRLGWERLPSGACYTRLLLEENQFLRGSGDDLRNFYYMLRLPPGWVRFNSVGRRVAPEVVRAFGGDPRRSYRLCFRVLGMGDRNGCSIAQATHEAILRAHGLLDPRKTLVYGEHVPDHDLWQGVYLDDLLVTLKITMPFPVPLDGSFIPPVAEADDEDMVVTAKAEMAYDKAGLQRALHKSFRAAVRFKAWGAEVDGIAGKVGAPLQTRRQVWSLLSQTVRAGRASKAMLQKLLGFAAHIFQYRREQFSVMHHLYVFVAGLPEEKVVTLPGYILDELRALALQMPFAFWCMRKRLFPSVLATDATPTSAGAVRALAPEPLLKELWRRSEIRGAPVRLDEHNIDFAGEAPLEVSHFAASVSLCLPWRVTASYSYRKTHHINLQEARALKKELIKLSSVFENGGSIQVCLNDSLVVVGAFTKGRSSSFKLNGIMRSLLPFLIAGNVAIAILWVETEANMGDHPSRFRPLPPARPPTRWMGRYGLKPPRCPVGLEVCAGAATVTRVYRGRGWPMLQPVNRIKDVLDSEIDRTIVAGEVDWMWLAPSCGASENLRRMWWGRVLHLAALMIQVGGFFVIVHPRESKAWSLRETELFLRHACVSRCQLELGISGGLHERIVHKQLTLLSNFPWLPQTVSEFASEWPSVFSAGDLNDVGCEKWGPIGEWLQHFARAHAKREGVAEWLVDVVVSLGGVLSPSMSPQSVDRWLEKAVGHAYEMGKDGTGRLEPIRSRVPMAFHVLQALLLTALARGFHYHGVLRAEYWSVMLGAWLAFDALLRPGEVDVLTVGDLFFPEGAEFGQGVSLVVGIRSPKTRRVWQHQFAMATDSALILWLRWWCAQRNPKQRVLRIARRRWQVIFKSLLEELGLQACRFTLGSLRAGRWSRPETLKHYLQEALSVQVFSQAPAEVSDFGMSGRLSRALRDLAAALDEVDAAAKESERSFSATLVGPPSSSSGGGTEKGPERAAGSGPQARAQATRTAESVRPTTEPTASSVAYRQDVRSYVIVSNPKNPSFVGYYEGQGASAWRAIESRLEGGGPGLGRGSSERADAGSPDVSQTVSAADGLLTAVNEAAATLGDQPVVSGLTPAQVLADPSQREQAARWRAGDSVRRLTSVLARMVQSLQAYGGAREAPAQPPRQPVLVETRPLRPSRQGAALPSDVGAGSWIRGLGDALRLFRLRLTWRTILFAVMVLLFPRLVALTAAVALRLLVKAVVSLLVNVFREVCHQFLGMAHDFEDQIIEWLSFQMGVGPSGAVQAWWPQVQPSLLKAEAEPPPPPTPPSTPATPSPTRPVDVVTIVLLFLNLRRPWQGGVGEPRG